jgi:hypothetical protein
LNKHIWHTFEIFIVSLLWTSIVWKVKVLGKRNELLKKHVVLQKAEIHYLL